MLIILGSGAKFFVLPLYQEAVIGTKISIATQTDQLKNRSAYLEDLKKIKKEYESIQSGKIEKLNLLLPPDDQIPELFFQLNAIVSESGLTSSAIDVTKITSEPTEQSAPLINKDGTAGEVGSIISPSSPKEFSKVKVETLQISLSVANGSYAKLKILLDKIERNIRLLDIQSVSFNNSFESIDITLNTYFSPS